MSESKAQMISTMAQVTGLDRNTIKDLMKKGWYFRREADTGRMAFFNPDPKGRH